MRTFVFSSVVAICAAQFWGAGSYRELPSDVLRLTVSADTVKCNYEHAGGTNAVWADNCAIAEVKCVLLPTKKIKVPSITKDPPFITGFKEIEVPDGVPCAGNMTESCPKTRSGTAGGGGGNVTDDATFNCQFHGTYGCKAHWDYIYWTVNDREYRTLTKFFKGCVKDGKKPVAGTWTPCGTYSAVANCGAKIAPPPVDPPIGP